MKVKMLLVLAATAWLLPAHAAFEPDELKWELPRQARRTGDVLAIELPGTGSLMARAAVDLTPFEGGVLKATISCRGKAVAPGPRSYLGFKFMLSFADATSRQKHWPGAKAETGDWDWKTVEILVDLRKLRPREAALSLGLQESRGRVEFDLSTLRLERVKPLFEYDRSTERCRYTERLSRAGARRGVMLPGGLCREEDFRTLRAWGVTLARYQMTRGWGRRNDNQDPAEYARWVDSRLDHLLDDVLPWANRYGVEIVVDLHVAPGGRREDGDMNMFYDPRFADCFIAVWKTIATRCRGRAGIWAYDLINEPCQRHEGAPNCDYWTLQARAAKAVRAIDATTPVVIESNGWDSPTDFETMRVLDLPDVIYQAHMYEPHEFTHQGVNREWAPSEYPDEARGWSRDYLRSVLQPVRDFQQRHGARIYLGEFSAIAWAKGADRYLGDCLALFEEYGWDWTYHAFREWSGWSVEHTCEGPAAAFRPSADNPRRRALLKAFEKDVQ